MPELKIGLLPLYIKLYDEIWPQLRPRVERFYQTVAAEFEKRGVLVVRQPVCRVEPEFSEAVKNFERQSVDAIVTLHLAYSPSLESFRCLTETALPVVVLDTTEVYEFSAVESDAEINYNHGIHGVQDLCSVLLRNGKRFTVEAGHYQQSDVLDRVIARVRGAYLAKAMRSARVGRVGRSLPGMGDFLVGDEEVKKNMGVTVVQHGGFEDVEPENGAPEIGREITWYRETFDIADDNAGLLEQSALAGLLLRSWVRCQNLSAVTVSFTELDSASGFPCMPYVECGRLMSEGFGYAGEGDVLTAALVGALLSVYPETTFAEMFCPDWKHNEIFLSHTGEMNYRLFSSRPGLVKVPFPFTDIGDSLAPCGTLMPGNALLVNLSPSAAGGYHLIVAPIKMKAARTSVFAKTVNGWFTPLCPLPDFLERYSMAGGTHHSSIVYNGDLKTFEAFAAEMGWKITDLYR